MINFENKKFNKNKLLSFGFQKKIDKYYYSREIFNNEFILNVQIDNNTLKTELIEKSTNDIYTLHLVEGIEGDFVGKIKEEYQKVLKEIEDNCFDTDVFKSEYTKKVIDYAKEKYQDEPEYLWEKFPNNAIFRRKDNKKWYAAILSVKENRLIPTGSENIIEVIDLRGNNVSEMIKEQNIYAGYHMNKKNWFSIILDGSVEIKKIYNMIDISYELAKKR